MILCDFKCKSIVNLLNFNSILNYFSIFCIINIILHTISKSSNASIRNIYKIK